MAYFHMMCNLLNHVLKEIQSMKSLFKISWKTLISLVVCVKEDYKHISPKFQTSDSGW
jgi:hypothetical protein